MEVVVAVQSGTLLHALSFYPLRLSRRSGKYSMRNALNKNPEPSSPVGFLSY